METTLIKNGRVYAPEDLGVTDLLLADGRVAAVGKLAGSVRADAVVDATGKLVLPGVIETHAHMLLPLASAVTQNDFYTGTVAGAFGGVTTLIDFADQKKGGSALEAIDARMRQAESAVIDYGFHCTFTDVNADTLREMEAVVEEGITSFKFYTTYKGDGLYVDDGAMLAAFRRARELGALATVHAENDDIIASATQALVRAGKTGWRYYPQCKPEISEVEAVSRMIVLAREAGVRLLVRHVSSGGGIRAIAAARGEGLPVYAETTPTYLLLTNDVYDGDLAPEHIVHPPIRAEQDREALWAALMNGSVETIGTDDCTFTREQKRRFPEFFKVPGGVPGIETRLPLLYWEGVMNRGLPVEQLVRITSTNVAALYDLPQKGRLHPGCDADVVVFDPHCEWKITAGCLHEMTDWNPFDGLHITGKVDKTYLRGKLIVDGGQCLAEKGGGRYLHRKPCMRGFHANA